MFSWLVSWRADQLSGSVRPPHIAGSACSHPLCSWTRSLPLSSFVELEPLCRTQDGASTLGDLISCSHAREIETGYCIHDHPPVGPGLLRTIGPIGWSSGPKLAIGVSLMISLFRRLIRCAVHPVQGFQERAKAAPGLGPAFGWMMLLRGAVSLAAGSLTLHAVYRDYPMFKDLQSPMWQEIFRRLPADINVEEARSFVLGLPDLPPWSGVWPWLLVLGPLGLAGAWLHNAVWDHSCLWLLGGVKKTGGWRTTFIAEAEAMQVGVLDAAFSLLSFIPLVGLLMAPLFILSGAYFWVLRGLALASFHHAPLWKGAVATLLHVLLAVLFIFGMLVISWMVVMQSVI